MAGWKSNLLIFFSIFKKRNMKENGLIIQCREEEYILGKMVDDMRVNIIRIRSMVMGFTNGMMGEVRKSNNNDNLSL